MGDGVLLLPAVVPGDAVETAQAEPLDLKNGQQVRALQGRHLVDTQAGGVDGRWHALFLSLL